MIKVSELLQQKIQYPAGEITIPIDSPLDKILLDIPTPEALLGVFQLSWQQETPIELYSWYIPSTRADKIGNFDIKAVAKLLKSGNFNKIYAADIHSSVSKNILQEELQEKLIIKSASQVLDANNYNFSDIDCIIAPDNGAIARAGEVALRHSLPLLIASKKRDQKTGYILEYHVDNPEGYQHGLVIDDICDGGMTFKLLNDSLNMDLNLYITHGVFSGNANNNLKLYKKVITTNSLLASSRLQHDNLEILDINKESNY